MEVSCLRLVYTFFFSLARKYMFEKAFLLREPRVKQWFSQFDTVFLINLLQNVSVLGGNILTGAMLHKFVQGKL